MGGDHTDRDEVVGGDGANCVEWRVASASETFRVTVELQWSKPHVDVAATVDDLRRRMWLNAVVSDWLRPNISAKQLPTKSIKQLKPTQCSTLLVENRKDSSKVFFSLNETSMGPDLIIYYTLLLNYEKIVKHIIIYRVAQKSKLLTQYNSLLFLSHPVHPCMARPPHHPVPFLLLYFWANIHYSLKLLILQQND